MLVGRSSSSSRSRYLVLFEPSTCNMLILYSFKISLRAVIGLTIGLVLLLLVLLGASVFVRRNKTMNNSRSKLLVGRPRFLRSKGAAQIPTDVEGVMTGKIGTRHKQANFAHASAATQARRVEKSQMSYADSDYGYQRAQWGAFWPAEKASTASLTNLS